MKKVLILLVLSTVLFVNFFDNSTYSVAAMTQNNQIRIYNSDIPYSRYLKFYIIDKNKIDLAFKYMSEDNEKKFLSNLSKEEKQDYKYAKKIQSIIDRGAWGEALYKYPDFYPALVQYYNNCINKNLYEEALRTMDKIRMADRFNQIFNKDIINKELANLYIRNKQYQKALDIFNLYENSYDENILSSIANCYYGMGEYQKAINYLVRIRNKKYKDNELLYTIYKETNDIQKAHQAAIVLNNQRYNFENLMKVQSTSQNDADKLKYAYQARNTTANESELAMVNKIITDLEQQKLDRQISTLKIFIKKPNWEYFKSQLPPNISSVELCQKQDEYFSIANKYLIKYDGQQLTNAFNSLNQDFTNYVQAKKNEYYQQQQAAMQQAQLEAQERQYYMQQQLIQQQKMQNYIRMQRIQNMGNRAYYSNPLYYDPFW